MDTGLVITTMMMTIDDHHPADQPPGDPYLGDGGLPVGKETTDY